MLQLHDAAGSVPATSTLILSDRLIGLAQEADRAGHRTTASDLIRLAHSVFDEPTHRAKPSAS